MAYFPVIAHMVRKIDQQIETGNFGDNSTPILDGFTHEQLNMVRAFVRSFDYSTFDRFPTD